ncbi:helix-turn-helix domain-containing protein [Flavobacterium sp.]|uniref:helix-turn-helix domain-containing protein n=1 Tax=Flavobacterium sp. TaxID=239 RepID=UPI00261A2AC8|nr:helix-turn-helix domain-containing protein [Flavobacterium sp.]
MINFFSRKTFFILLLPITLLGQVKKNDLEKLPYDTLKKLYFDNSNNKTKQIEYAKAYLNKANKENISIRKARGYYWFALLYYDNNGTKAIKYLDSVIKYSKTSKDPFFPTAAYCEKAELLKKQFKFKEALINYNLAEDSALKTNIDYYYIVRNAIGITKSEDLGQIEEALTIYKECFRFYKSKNVKNPKYAIYYQNIIFGLADCYKSLNQVDSTTYYNRLGYRESQITKNEEYKYLFILNEGANHVLKKQFKSALDSISKALPKMIAYNNVGNTLASYYYLGKAHSGLNHKDEAVINYIKVDSIYQKTKDITPEFMGGYQYLINYYKDKGDKVKQLHYLMTLTSIDKILNKNYKELNKLVEKEYDTPHLIIEKETLIQSLKNDKSKSSWIIVLLLIITIIIASLGIYQHRLKKTYKKRFEKIVNDKSLSAIQETSSESISLLSRSKNTNSENIGIGKEVITQILQKLQLFEDEKRFLHSNITIQSLSKEFDTNNKYLSRIVNEFKNKTFIQYINDLRIDYAIEIIKNNNIFRKYTIQALALEFGFNNAESFSAAFYKKTGIKPTFFIKELENS